MLSTLDDPFTRFLEPEKFKSLRVWLSFAYIIMWCQENFALVFAHHWCCRFMVYFEVPFWDLYVFFWRQSGTQGALTGVGLSIGYPMMLNGSDTGLVVISSSPGGPASKAGIVPGDVILAIDDTSTEDMDIYDAADRLQ